MAISDESILSRVTRRVRLLGDLRRREFQPAVQTIARLASLSGVGVVNGNPLDPCEPDLVIVLQSYPDEFQEQDLTDLLLDSPLARIICLYGRWCDADGRTRDLWPAGVRVPHWRLDARLKIEWQLVNGEEKPILPLTASRDEIFRFTFSNIPDVSRKWNFQIDSPDPQLKRMLEEALRPFQRIPSSERGEEQRPDWILFDVDPWSEKRHADLDECRRTFSQSRILPIVGFPDTDFSQNLSDWGLKPVWPKLSPLADLLQIILRSDQQIS